MDGHIAEIAIAVFTLVNSIVLLLGRRNQQHMQLRLAEIETRGQDAKLDGENVNTALSLVATVVAAFESFKTFQEKLVERVDVKHDETQKVVAGAAQENRLAHQVQLDRFDQAASTMASVTKRRDGQYSEIIKRLDKQNSQIEVLSKKISLASIQTEIRGDIIKLVQLTTDISDGVKMLLPRADEPGEAKQPEPEPSVNAPTPGEGTNS